MNKKYLIYRIMEWIFVTLISAGLGYNILSGFELNMNSANTLGIFVLINLCMVAVCMAVSKNKTITIMAIIAGVAVVAALVILYRGNNIFIHDEENNKAIFLIVSFLIAVVTFLITRTRIGIVILLVIGNLIHAGAAFLEFPCSLVAYLIFDAAIAILFLQKVYQVHLVKARIGKVAMRKVAVQNICICVIAFAIACACFYGVIKPLNPPTQELKLIQRLMSLEVLEKAGVSSVQIQLDPNKEADQESEKEWSVNGNPSAENDQQQTEDPSSESGTTSENLAGNAFHTVAENVEQVKAVSYEAASHWYAFVIIAAAVIAGLIWIKWFTQRNWYLRIRNMSAKTGILNLYDYFMKGFQKLGIKKNEHQTLDEYMELMHAEFTVFSNEQITVQGLTKIYEKAYYGAESITEEEVKLFYVYYENFLKMVRKNNGIWKAMKLFFCL